MKQTEAPATAPIETPVPTPVIIVTGQNAPIWPEAHNLDTPPNEGGKFGHKQSLPRGEIPGVTWSPCQSNIL